MRLIFGVWLLLLVYYLYIARQQYRNPWSAGMQPYRGIRPPIGGPNPTKHARVQIDQAREHMDHHDRENVRRMPSDLRAEKFKPDHRIFGAQRSGTVVRTRNARTAPHCLLRSVILIAADIKPIGRRDAATHCLSLFSDGRSTAQDFHPAADSLVDLRVQPVHHLVYYTHSSPVFLVKWVSRYIIYIIVYLLDRYLVLSYRLTGVYFYFLPCYVDPDWRSRMSIPPSAHFECKMSRFFSFSVERCFEKVAFRDPFT
jgi:hypothetical protein